MSAYGSAYIGIDAGTGFSSHGSGLFLGLNAFDDIRIDLGTGNAKAANAGYPLSLDFYLDTKKNGKTDYNFIGFTYYQGNGETVMTFRNSLNESDLGDLSVLVNGRWKILYARIGIGSSKSFFWDLIGFWDVGFSANIYSKIEPDLDDYHGTNLGTSVGISTGRDLYYWNTNSMGVNDAGFFARAGIRYEI